MQGTTDHCRMENDLGSQMDLGLNEYSVLLRLVVLCLQNTTCPQCAPFPKLENGGDEDAASLQR